MMREIISITVAIDESQMLVLSKLYCETNQEYLIEIHRLLSINYSPIPSNLGSSLNVHIMINMGAKEYLYQTGMIFIAPKTPGDYPLTFTLTYTHH